MRNSYSNNYLLDLPLLLMVFFYGRYLEFLAEELSQKCGTGYTKLIVVSDCTCLQGRELVQWYPLDSSSQWGRESLLLTL